MSGIALLFERNGAPASADRIERMLARLRQRGPDGAALHVDGSVALAQALLQTTPEDAFDRQPLASRDGKTWIVADARIDNRKELLADLGEPAERTDEIPDAALILRSYQRWGEACAARLIGDFAFAIWDATRARIFCARDHLGVRQLYYHADAGTFRCATEMNALFADERVARRPSWRSMALFLTLMYAERDETLYEGVRALPPGSILCADRTSVVVASYWRPDPWRASAAGTDADHAAQFREVFSEAVRCRLRAHRPMGCDVSGGLDSSSVACEGERLRRAGRVSSLPLTLIRAVFPGLDCDETPYSTAVADQLNLPMETCIPKDHPYLSRLEQQYPDLYYHPTLAITDPRVIALRDRGARAFLTGIGGDLLMRPTGFEPAHYLRRGRLRAAAVVSRPRAGVGALRTLASQSFWALSPRVASAIHRRRRRAASLWPWLSPGAAEVADEEIARQQFDRERLHPDPHLAELAHGVQSENVLLPAARIDRLGASREIEHRHPFYDRRVIDLLLSMPTEQRFTRAQPKRVLRAAMGDALPLRVRSRADKANFGSFVDAVLLSGQASALRELFQTSRVADAGLLAPRELKALLDLPPEAQPSARVVELAALELWLRAI